MKTVIAGALAVTALAATLAVGGAAAAWPRAIAVSSACPAAHHAAFHPLRHQVVFRHAPRRAWPAGPAWPTAYPAAAAAYGPAAPVAAYGAPAYGPAFQGGVYVRPAVYGGPVFARPGFHRALFARGFHRRAFAHPFFGAGFHPRGYRFHATRVAWRGEGHRFARHAGPHRFG